MLEMRMNIRDSFPECVAKGSCFLSWGSAGGGLFACRFVFFLWSRRPAAFGESEKRWCVETCESAFRVAGVGLCGTQAKVASPLSDVYVAALSMGKVSKGDVTVRSVECEVCSGECGDWSVECEVWSVKCRVWNVECEAWSVKCGVESGECEVWSVLKCEGEFEVWRLWSVECEMCSEQCRVWSVECDVWSVECGVWSVEWEVWSVECDVWCVER